MKYLCRKLLLFDTSFQSFSIHPELEPVLSCQSLRNEAEKQSKSVGVMSFTVYHAMHINRLYSCVRRRGPLREPMWQRVVWLQCDTEPLGGTWSCKFGPDSKSFTLPQWPNKWFFGFIFVFMHQIITWWRVISPVSAQDKPVSLNLQHGSPSLYQTLHFPAPFSSGSHPISPLHFSFFSSPGPYMKWKDRTRNSSVPAGQLWPKDIHRQVIIHHSDSLLSVQDKDSC